MNTVLAEIEFSLCAIVGSFFASVGQTRLGEDFIYFYVGRHALLLKGKVYQSPVLHLIRCPPPVEKPTDLLSS